MFTILPNWHPIFVHFSVAMLLSATLLHLASHVIRNADVAARCALVARWNLWIGTLLTVFTVIAGWFAFNSVDHDTPSHLAMKEHRNWALVTFSVFAAIVAWDYTRQRRGQAKSWAFSILLIIAAGLLLSTAWHGGELVYRYGLGVMALPTVEGEGHAHDHGDAHGHAASPATGTASPPMNDGHAHEQNIPSDHHADDSAPVDVKPDAKELTEEHTHPSGTPLH